MPIPPIANIVQDMVKEAKANRPKKEIKIGMRVAIIIALVVSGITSIFQPYNVIPAVFIVLLLALYKHEDTQKEIIIAKWEHEDMVQKREIANDVKDLD